MANPAIICIDDQPEVLAAVSKDLEPFAGAFDIIECDSAEEAWELLEEREAAGEPVVCLVADCVMPGTSGVDLMARVDADDRFDVVRKIMLTGQASHGDTIEAINKARIDHYLAKPWQPEQLHAAMRTQIAHWLVATGRPPTAYPDLVDMQVIFEAQRQGGSDR